MLVGQSDYHIRRNNRNPALPLDQSPECSEVDVQPSRPSSPTTQFAKARSCVRRAVHTSTLTQHIRPLAFLHTTFRGEYERYYLLAPSSSSKILFLRLSIALGPHLAKQLSFPSRYVAPTYFCIKPSSARFALLTRPSPRQCQFPIP